MKYGVENFFLVTRAVPLQSAVVEGKSAENRILSELNLIPFLSN